MTITDLLVDADARCGSRWLSGLDANGRAVLLGSLLSRFNHDLRTPLNTILGWTHLLQKGELDAMRAKHVADVIARNSRDQTQLLEDFVDDGRTILQGLQLQPSAVLMDEAVRQAIGRLQSMLTLHGVRLEEQLEAADASVDGDPRRLERLVYRLLYVVTRRAPEASAARAESEVSRGAWLLSLSASAYEPDWQEAALLDLRISTLVAAVHGGELVVGADAKRPCILLRLPCSIAR